MAENKLGHIDQRLTDISIAYKQADFVAANLFPEKPVMKGSDLFTVFKKGNAFQVVDDKMDKNSDAHELQIGNGTDTFVVKDYGLRGFVTQDDIDNADDPLSPEADETEALTGAILLNREIRSAAVVSAMSTNTAAVGTKWAVATGSPITDIEAAANLMFVRPNVMVVSRPVWDLLKFNTQILGAIGGGFTGLKIATTEMIAQLFNLDRVIIAGARKSSTKMPIDPTLGFVWGKSCVLAFVPPTITNKTMAFGCLFAKKIAGGATFSVRKWPDPSKGVGGRIVIQVEHQSVQKLISEDFGYHLSACIA